MKRSDWGGTGERVNGRTDKRMNGKTVFIFHCQLSIVNCQLKEYHPVAPRHPSEGGELKPALFPDFQNDYFIVKTV
jgi:hypothetical protein